MGEWPIRQPGDLIILGGALMLVFGVADWLFGFFFCARTPPRWMVGWLSLALALVGARLLSAKVFDVPLDWFSGALYTHLGVVIAVIALYRWWRVIGAQGDRCE